MVHLPMQVHVMSIFNKEIDQMELFLSDRIQSWDKIRKEKQISSNHIRNRLSFRIF